MRKLKAFLAALVILIGAAAALPVRAYGAEKSETLPLQTLALVNEQRAAAGEAPLAWNQGLAEAAMVRAAECEKSFSHTRPDGTEWWTVDSDLMYGENLARGYYDAGSVVSAWMASPGHRANILNAGYTTVGIAVHQAQDGTWYWAEEFGY